MSYATLDPKEISCSVFGNVFVLGRIGNASSPYLGHWLFYYCHHLFLYSIYLPNFGILWINNTFIVFPFLIVSFYDCGVAYGSM